MIGVIADDLTGAAELAAAGLRQGLRAEIVREGGRPGGTAELVCVDTDSRSCPADEAARRAAAAANMLRSSGAGWIYKKVDSVLRGNVIPEIEAVMVQLGLRRALMLPANPSLGRVIRDGRYFVHGRPIDQTEFANDPEYPRRSPQVIDLLDQPRHFMLRVSDGGRSVPDGTILVGQAETNGDIRDWARAGGDAQLPAGGVDFFVELLGATVPRAEQPSQDAGLQQVDFGSGRQLFICGSASKSSEALVEEARKNHGAVFDLPRELMSGGRLQAGQADGIARQVVERFASTNRVILAIGLPQVSDVAIAAGLCGQLVDIAVRVLRQMDVQSVFAEGGATAAELVRQMDWPRLEVCREWLPGVATMAVPGNRPRWLTIKPGSYSWPDEWTSCPQ